MARILALDYGSKRVGVAITDPDQIVAFPREVWIIQSDEDVLQRVKEIVAVESIERILVGLPLSLDGNRTPQTKKTETFIQKLETIGVPVETIDERWTTIQAERSGGDDSVAAQIFLMTYIERARARNKTS